MKVRVKFSKTGPVKFVGHLDTLRYFQKAMRRANIDVALSEGYSPHMIMSFASPLGVGVTTEGDYFDMELNSADNARDMIKRLNDTMVDGIRILNMRQVPENKRSNCMALVSACDYLVSFRENRAFTNGWIDRIDQFLEQENILCEKKTKKKTREINIRPLIFQMEVHDASIFLKLSSGSVNNLKPEMVLDAFAKFLGEPLAPYALEIHRLETYASAKDSPCRFVPLESLGTVF